MANTIQIRRGAIADIPTLAQGSLGYATDTDQVFIGDGAANHELLMHHLFDANTILAADSDNTPAALTISEQTVLGRITSGNIKGLTATELRTLINVADGADVTADAQTSSFAFFIS